MSDNVFKLYTEYKHLYLFQSEDGSVLFRLLPFDKTKIVERIVKAYPTLTPTIEDNIWDECVIEHSFSTSKRDMNAGVISTIVRLVMRLSSPQSIDEIVTDLDHTRENLNDIRDQIVNKICEAFPAYTPEDVEAMDWQTQIQRLAQAEKVLGTEFNLTSGDQSSQQMQAAGIQTRIGVDGNEYIDFKAENSAMRG